MAKYIVASEYADGSKRTLETSDGKRAMKEASNACYPEDIAKDVTLTKDGDAIYSEKVLSWKDQEKKNADSK